MEGAADTAAPSNLSYSKLRDGLRRGDRLQEDGVARRTDLVETVRLQGRVPVLVEPVGAEHGIAILDREQRLEHVGAVVPIGSQARDRVEPELHRLVTVDGIRIGV